MKYCKKCNHVFSEEATMCEGCKKSVLKIEDSKMPVFVASAGDYDKSRAFGALKDFNIPFFERQHRKGINAQAITGESMHYIDILVPFEFYEEAYDILVGIGVIKLEGEEVITNEADELVQELSEEESNEEYNLAEQEIIKDSAEESMSSGKRFFVKVVSVVLFVVVVALVIFATDFVTKLVTSNFY